MWGTAACSGAGALAGPQLGFWLHSLVSTLPQSYCFVLWAPGPISEDWSQDSRPSAMLYRWMRPSISRRLCNKLHAGAFVLISFSEVILYSSQTGQIVFQHKQILSSISNDEILKQCITAWINQTSVSSTSYIHSAPFKPLPEVPTRILWVWIFQRVSSF